jgi:FkbM family methyltransferase
MRTVAARILRWVLRSRGGAAVERALVALGHRYPDRLPGRGVIQAELGRRHAGSELVARLFEGSWLVVPCTREGLFCYFHGRAFKEDEALTRFLLRHIRDGAIFFDVGANLGYYTILAASLCGPGGRVHAFEPQRLLARHLRGSIERNAFADRVCLTEAAVGADHGGSAALFCAHDDETFIGIPSLLRHPWLEGGHEVTVPLISLDEYVREHGVSQVDGIKIDVEGAEMLVLEGMREILKTGHPRFVLLEVWGETLHFDSFAAGAALRPAAGSTRFDAMRDFMRDHGYEAHALTPDGTLGAPFEGPVCGSMNLAFVQEER